MTFLNFKNCTKIAFCQRFLTTAKPLKWRTRIRRCMINRDEQKAPAV